ncbi:MAG TPA: tetratricopeptide repeat protein, partial [Kiloniellaceae bacterium]|nr:tetratricopeptide repeat protein [Kiloniellaceae bacterium]
MRRIRNGVLTALLILPAVSAAAQKPLDPSIQSLDYGETLYQFYQGRYFSAITHLRAAQAKQTLGEDAEQGEMLLGGLYLGYGMHDEAERIFQQMLARSARPEVQDTAWFWLGKVRYRRGLHREALAAFARVGGRLPDNLAAEKRVMEGLILMRKKDYSQAAEVLTVTEDDDSEWSAYARFNRAVSLVRAGRSAEGEAELAALGAVDVESEEQKTLRDRANFALGIHLLREGRNDEAKDVLHQVRLEALQSNQALLAAGWSDAREEHFDAALVPWMQLDKRPLHEPAVAEALLAVPYALSRLGGRGEALEHYRKAEEALEEELGLVQGMEENIAGGRFLKSVYVVTEEIRQGPPRELLSLDQEGRYLGPLLADNRFREALRDYLDLAFLKQHLAHRSQSLDAFDAMLEARRVSYDRQLPRVQEYEANSRYQALLAR